MSLTKSRALLVAGAAFLIAASPASAQTFEGPEFEAAIQRYLEENPEVIIGSINAYVEGQKAAEAAAENERFLAASAEFTAEDGLPVIGNPDGGIVMYYVLDAACTYCRQMEPVLKTVIEQNPDVKIVQRWVPFLSPASEYAARLAFLVSERHPGKYEEFYEKLMTKTGQLTNDTVDSVLKEVVGDEAWQVLRTDAVDGAEGLRVAGLVQRNLDIVSTAGVAGTPFFYVEDAGTEGIIRGAGPVQVLQAAIDKAKAAN